MREGPAADRLRTIAARVVNEAGTGELIDVKTGRSISTSVRVRDADVESFTSATSDAIGIRVISEGRVGFASAGSIDEEVVRDCLEQARSNAQYSEVDPDAGFADPDGIAPIYFDQWNDELLNLTPARKIEIALDLERRVMAGDPRMVGVRSATFSDGSAEAVFATSAGVLTYDGGTSCSAGVSALADDGKERQAGGAGRAGLSLEGLDFDRLVSDAIDRTVRLFGATRPRSGRMPIIMGPEMAMTFFGVVSGMLDGDSVSRQRSPFASRVGEEIASPSLTLVDDPTDARSIMATSHDGEGLACRRNVLIERGVLIGFLHNAATARRMGVGSTGSAIRSVRGLPTVGAMALAVTPGVADAAALRRDVGEAIWINSLSGLHSGVNPISGDFSVGADGLMVRGGEFVEPVREFTLASTLQKMLMDLAAIGGDGEWTPSGDFGPSIVIDGVSVGGA